MVGQSVSDGQRWTAEDLSRHLAKLDGSKQKIKASVMGVGSRLRAAAAALEQSEIVDGAKQETKATGRQKFNAKSETVDGHYFRSGKEAQRYRDLVLLERVGAIQRLELQPRFDLIACNGEIVGRYTADFKYLDLRLGRVVIEDTKGGNATKTEAYRLRKRLFEACYGPILTET